MGSFFQDFRYTIRTLIKNPAFTLVAVVALALAIGANTAIFSVVNGVLLKPLPFKEPERLVYLLEKSKRLSTMMVAYPDYIDWKEQNSVFEDMAIYNMYRSLNLTGLDEPERIPAALVSANIFDLVGVSPALGRGFTTEEDRLGADRVVIMGHALWQRRFGSDPAIIGRQLTLDGSSYTVIAVMPPGFRFPGQVELWVPIGPNSQPFLNRANHPGLWAVARLNPGVTMDQARMEMDTIAARLAEQYPETNSDVGVNFLPAAELAVGGVRPALLVLLGAVGFVLLIACANIANLLLARATARQKEIAIRTALGATRTRIVRQLLTESLALSFAGGALGLLLAWWAVGVLVKLAPSAIPRVSAISLDGRVMGFTLLVSLLTAVIFGLLPALQASKPDLNEALKEGSRSLAGGVRGRRLRSGLVVAETGMALVLLIGAGLMVRSFILLQQIDPGFNPENVLTMRIALPLTKYPDGLKRALFFEQALARVESIPGMQSAAVISPLPFSNEGWQTGITIGDHPAPPKGQNPLVDTAAITPDYFRAMSIPLRKGRFFSEADKENAPRVVIVNEAMAGRFWPDEDALGKQIKTGDYDSTEPWMSVVGVVADVKRTGLDLPARPEMYLPYPQSPQRVVSLVARGDSSLQGLGSAIQREIWAVDKDQPVYAVSTMEGLLASSVAQPRFSMLLLTVFAGVALALAAVGIYGVIAYSVTQRTHEIGVRMALGARSGDIMRLVVGQGMALTGLGVAAGLAAALVLTRVMSSLLYGVSATDPATFIVIPLVLASVAFAASYIPARRASRVDPMVALRYE